MCGGPYILQEPESTGCCDILLNHVGISLVGVWTENYLGDRMKAALSHAKKAVSITNKWTGIQFNGPTMRSFSDTA